jgi:class 3 adenylate cyclase
LAIYRDLAAADPSATDFITTDPDAIGLGTDPDEYLVGPELAQLLRAQIQASGRTIVVPGRLEAFQEGSFGWVVDTPTWTMSDGFEVQIRWTLLFRREGADWKCVHFHTSIGVPNEDALGGEFTAAFDEILDDVAAERPDMTPTMSSEGTVTIMFTDMESSTATNEALGDDAFLPLLFKHNEIVRKRTAACGGSVVKSQGDGFMLAFPSARRGVECAIGVQQEVALIDGPIRVRMGLHTGEPVRAADDFYGRDVAYAARIGAAAIGGEILVSDLVRSLVAPSGSITFDGPRDMDLKGFDGLQPVYSVKWRA